VADLEAKIQEHRCERTPIFYAQRARVAELEADYQRCCELNERLCYEVHDLKAALATERERK
jgi:hypothetical protein